MGDASSSRLEWTLSFDSSYYQLSHPSLPPSTPIGNAWTDPVLDNHGALDFWYSHGLIAHTTYDGVRENCDFSRVGPLKQVGGKNVSTKSDVPRRWAIPSERLHHRNTIPLTLLQGQNVSKDEALCDAFVEEAMNTFTGINIYDM